MKTNNGAAGKYLSLVLLISLITMALATLFTTGCGMGSTGNMHGDDQSGVMQGTFLDSPVEGVHYLTDTLAGITDENGSFQYMEGETIRFSIGDIQLGQGMAQRMMTPVDLVPGAVDETHPTVTNMCRFLQTIDEDYNPENGISITEETVEELYEQDIDFEMDPIDFEDDPEVQAVMTMDSLNHTDTSGQGREMVSIEQAQAHMQATMMEMMQGGDMMMYN